MRLSLAAGLLCAIAGCSAVLAEDEGFRFTPRLVNEPTGGKFIAEGGAGELPEGTMIHVELLVRGQSRHPIRAAFMKLEVKDKAFQGEWTWTGKKLAPLTYEAIATLRMNKQPPPVRRALAKAYGWHGDHNETLSSTEVALGTPEEAEAFKQETLDRLIQAIEDLEGFIKDGVDLCSVPADSEGWNAKFQELAGEIRVRYRIMRDFHQSVVVRQQEGLFKRLINIYSGMTDALRAHQAGQAQGLETLVKLPEATAILREEITSRMPVKPSEELGPKPKTPEDGAAPDEGGSDSEDKGAGK